MNENENVNVKRGNKWTVAFINQSAEMENVRRRQSRS